MNKIEEAAIRLLLYSKNLGKRLVAVLNRREIIIAVATLAIMFAAPITADAFDPKAGAQNVMEFIKFLILLGAAVTACTMLLKSHMVPAVILIMVAGTIYVVLDESTMKALGKGIATLIGLDSGSQ